MKNQWKTVVLVVSIVLLLLVGVGAWGCWWRARAHEAAAQAGALTVDTVKAKARVSATVESIGLTELENDQLRDDIADRDARIERLARLVVEQPEVVYVSIPAEQTEGPPPEGVTGRWEADLPDAWLAFELPEAVFDLRLKPRSADLEIVWDDYGVVGVSTDADWLMIGDVTGLRTLGGAPRWSLAGTLRYPPFGVGTALRFDWAVVGLDYTFDTGDFALRAGVEINLGG